ncbi:hypothetical protein [Aggregatilinea lenta]|uniref:hypothetical protein n=1 Tax=Aggregatilinea lenta TaxID=913108 RepID=UPI000E5A34B8|nr:hypothetical protein [Aggregatilinea lenta]
MSEQSSHNPSTLAPPVTLPEAENAAKRKNMQLQCPRCGSTDIGTGYLIDYSDKFRQLQLAPRSLKLTRIARLLRPFRHLIPVNARVCRECGAVTLEVDPNDFAAAEERYGRR